MKKVLLFFIFLGVTLTSYATEEGVINGYFLFNYNNRYNFWPMGTHPNTSIGIKYNTITDLYITESEGNVKWTIPSDATSYLYIIYQAPDGKHILFETRERPGVVRRIAEDENNNLLTIDIYVSTGGLE